MNGRTDIQTDRQTDTQTDRHADMQAGRPADRWMDTFRNQCHMCSFRVAITVVRANQVGGQNSSVSLLISWEVSAFSASTMQRGRGAERQRCRATERDGYAEFLTLTSAQCPRDNGRARGRV